MLHTVHPSSANGDSMFYRKTQPALHCFVLYARRVYVLNILEDKQPKTNCAYFFLVLTTDRLHASDTGSAQGGRVQGDEGLRQQNLGILHDEPERGQQEGVARGGGGMVCLQGHGVETRDCSYLLRRQAGKEIRTVRNRMYPRFAHISNAPRRNQEARALFMGLMYETPSYGRAYFEGETPEKPVVVGIGAAGVQLLDASDGDRPVLAEYAFDIIGSFVCSDEVRTGARLLACRLDCCPWCALCRVLYAKKNVIFL